MVMKPPSGGPTIGPTRAGIVTRAMASMSLLFSTVRTRTRRPTGVIIAPPMPWMKRATTKCHRAPAKAQPTEPSTKTMIAVENVVRAPNRSAIQPLIGMKTASASR